MNYQHSKSSTVASQFQIKHEKVMKTCFTKATFCAPLTYKALRSHQLQSYFISQDGGVAMGDVGKWASVDKHRSSLQIKTTTCDIKPITKGNFFLVLFSGIT